MEMYLLQKTKVNKPGRVVLQIFSFGYALYLLCCVFPEIFLFIYLVLLSPRDDQQECPLSLSFEEVAA